MVSEGQHAREPGAPIHSGWSEGQEPVVFMGRERATELCRLRIGIRRSFWGRPVEDEKSAARRSDERTVFIVE